MSLRSRFRPRKALRVVPFHLEALEDRRLLSTGLTAPSSGLGTTITPTTGVDRFNPIVILGPATPDISSTTGSSGFVGPVGASDGLGTTTNGGGGGVTPSFTGPYTPAQIRTAYGLSQLDPGYTGAGQTIALVDDYDDTEIASDLATFDTKFNLPAPPKFTQVNPAGTSLGDDPSGGWDGETSLDVEWAHAMAPMANILLVEGNVSNNATDAQFQTAMAKVVQYAAAQPGVYQVSMSYGVPQSASDVNTDSVYNHPGITFFASAGDSGAAVNNPADSPYVTSVGGTSLTTLNNTGAYGSETGWTNTNGNGSTGGGYSTVETRPAYQNGFQTNKGRGIPDVSFDADPDTGVEVYDKALGGFFDVGGTSLSSPAWAGIMALVNQGRLADGFTTVGTGLTYGTDTALYNLAGGTSYLNAGGDFHDITSGSNGLSATVGWDPVTGLGTPVVNKLVPDLTGGPAPVAPVSAPGAVLDASFETDQVGSGSGGYAYDPTGSNWTFTGTAGISGNASTFTSGNPSAPQGAQVAFIQKVGSFKQSIMNVPAGTYQIHFSDAQRGNYQTTSENFEVKVDTTVVGTFTPLSTSYRGEATATITLAKGTHSITFLGLDTQGTSGADNSVLIDNVSLGSTVTTVPTVGDSSFETVQVGTDNYDFTPTGSSWVFASGSGLAANGSGFTLNNPAAPTGTQVAFIQGAGSFSQSIANWAVGSYQVSFSIAQRANNQPSQQTIKVLEDGTVIGTFTPQGATYENDISVPFTFTAAGTHVITFEGTDPFGGGNTALIDNVAVTSVNLAVSSGTTAQTPPTVSDPAFAQVSTTGYTMDPTSPYWAYTGTAGIATNGSTYTANNPSSPEGTQVGFIEGQGGLSQTVAKWASGNYMITFTAAKRIYSGQSANEDFDLLIDGTPVTTFTPSSSSYTSFWSAPFTVTAGSHIVSFVGLDSAGGDNTSLINGVTVVTAS